MDVITGIEEMLYFSAHTGALVLLMLIILILLLNLIFLILTVLLFPQDLTLLWLATIDNILATAIFMILSFILLASHFPRPPCNLKVDNDCINNPSMNILIITSLNMFIILFLFKFSVWMTHDRGVGPHDDDGDSDDDDDNDDNKRTGDKKKIKKKKREAIHFADVTTLNEARIYARQTAQKRSAERQAQKASKCAGT